MNKAISFRRGLERERRPPTRLRAAVLGLGLPLIPGASLAPLFPFAEAQKASRQLGEHLRHRCLQGGRSLPWTRGCVVCVPWKPGWPWQNVNYNLWETKILPPAWRRGT